MLIPYNHDHENEIVFFALTNFRNQQRKFGIKTDDRRRHVYMLGKTGMGKTTLLENMVLQDIIDGHGVGVVDPHGDFAEKLLDYIPSWRLNDVVYFNPADQDWPVGFNVLEAVDDSHKHLIAAGLMGVFKKIWPDVWSPRMEHILNNCILSLLEYPGSTLLGINRILVDTEFRKRVVAKLKDPVVKAFWIDEYQRWEPRFRNEAIAPIQNKVGQFLAASIIRNIVAQVKSTIHVRNIMDERKILIMNLAKGRIGEDNSRLLGGMLITKVQLSAMERVELPEKEREDFYLYVDEFQNFATQSFANILSEARKYRLNLIIAHQYIEQLDEEYVRPAVFGNVGTIILFRVGGADSEFLEKEFAPRFMATDLVNLGKYDIYLRLMIDGVASDPFSATTLPPIASRTDNLEKVVKISRERYATPRHIIEEKILRWSGMAPADGSEDGETDAATPLVGTAHAGNTQSDGAAPLTRASGRSTVGATPGSTLGKCASCGIEFRLPFVPQDNRPVYCEQCFKARKKEMSKPMGESRLRAPGAVRAEPVFTAVPQKELSLDELTRRTPPLPRVRIPAPSSSRVPERSLRVVERGSGVRREEGRAPKAAPLPSGSQDERRVDRPRTTLAPGTPQRLDEP